MARFYRSHPPGNGHASRARAVRRRRTRRPGTDAPATPCDADTRAPDRRETARDRARRISRAGPLPRPARRTRRSRPAPGRDVRGAACGRSRRAAPSAPARRRPRRSGARQGELLLRAAYALDGPMLDEGLRRHRYHPCAALRVERRRGQGHAAADAVAEQGVALQSERVGEGGQLPARLLVDEVQPVARGARGRAPEAEPVVGDHLALQDARQARGKPAPLGDAAERIVQQQQRRRAGGAGAGPPVAYEEPAAFDRDGPFDRFHAPAPLARLSAPGSRPRPCRRRCRSTPGPGHRRVP